LFRNPSQPSVTIACTSADAAAAAKAKTIARPLPTDKLKDGMK
jgi:hypothetical protein